MTLRWNMREFGYEPSQDMIFRAVAGAVMNTAHGHPDWWLDKIKARSIAKRATGTLSAQLGELAVAKAPSDKDRENGVTSPRSDRAPSARKPQTLGHEPPSQGAHERRGTIANQGCKPRGRPSPLRLAHIAVGILTGQARRAGDTKRAEALADALRVIGQLRREHPGT